MELREIKALFSREKAEQARKEIAKVIVGQENLIEHILICFFAGGHILMEAKPGYAKTLTALVFSRVCNAVFKKIQFTPDMRPSDVKGYEIPVPIQMQMGKEELKERIREEFQTIIRKGPVFTNILLADEVNRTPPKVHSALLEAMQEKEVTIGPNTFKLEDLFFVLATMNPVEVAGIYKLEVAFLDRFMLSTVLVEPTLKEESKIAISPDAIDAIQIAPVYEPKDIMALRELLRTRKLLEENSPIVNYMTRIIRGARPETTEFGFIKEYVKSGASPRALKHLLRASFVLSHCLKGEKHILVEHVNFLLLPILRHRLILRPKAVERGIDSTQVIQMLLEAVPVVAGFGGA